MNAQQELIHFVQSAKGLDNPAKLKLILLVAGAKPATFFALKITPENLGEKAHLEHHLRACGLLFSVGRARAYEEITGMTGNAVKWSIRGSWYGYDVFKDKKHAQLFKQYLALLAKQKHVEADRVAGKLYAYPSCCVGQYIQEHDLAFLRKNYTHYSYYKRLRDCERVFPFIQHMACSVKCAKSKKLNAQYAAALKKRAPKFFREFSRSKKFSCEVVVDSESVLLQDVVYGIRSTASVFPVRDGHEYSLLTMKKLQGHYYLLAHLTKETLVRGTVLPAKITMRHGYADAVLGKPKRVIKNLHHERHFALP
jgi:hypothetical protein